MNKNFLALILFFLFLCLNVNAILIENPDFEDYINLDTNTENWTVKIPSDGYADVYSDTNGECGGSHGSGDWGMPVDYGQWELAGNPSGDNVFFAQSTAGKRFINVNDYYIGTLQSDLNFCFSFKQSTADKISWGYGIYKQDQNILCEIAGVGNPATVWSETCRTIPAGIYNGYFTLYHTRTVDAGAFNLFIDGGFSGMNLEVQIENHTVSEASAGTEVTLKTKVSRTDLNTFVSDANVYLVSDDFNGSMVYNATTEYYELAHTFPSDQLGTYSFDVNAIDSVGDLNYSNNKETFSLTFIKATTLIVNVSNTTKISEYQTGSDSYYTILSPDSDTEDLIFYFNGADSNNFGDLIDFNFTVRNPDLSGQRYLVYTASETEYTNGTWNFDSTLSFGSTIYNGLQKIWIDANSYYEYGFLDSTMYGNEIKYFKLKYETPFKQWNSLHSDLQNDWDIQFLPSYVIAEDHYRDYFPISQFNGMRNQYKTLFPDINSNQDFNKFLLAFNGQVPTGSFNESIGSYRNESNSDVVATVSVTPNETTFYVPISYDYPVMKGDSATYIELMNSDYALIERGFFIEPITLLNSDYSVVERLLIEGVSAKVIREQHPFRIQSKLYNNNGELSFLEARVYFNGVEDINQVAYFKKDLNSLAANEIYSLDWLVDGITDLNGTGARDFVVVLKATTKTGDWFEIQTDTFKLRQFPAYSDEFNLNFYITNKKVGEHLSGVVQINVDNPDALRGLSFSLWKPDTQSIEANDYNTTLFKGTDFTCSGFSCTFDFTFLDHVLDDQVVWALNLSALLTTQLEDTNSFLTAKTIRFSVYFQDINYMRIVETMERTAHTYKHTEPIPLTLILVRGDLQPTRDDLKIVLRAANCSTDATDGTCTDIDINYSADSYVYDPTTGENFYFWRQIYVDQDLSLFDDADYYRFYAIIESLTGKFSSTLKPLLSAKCQTYDAGDFGHQVLHFFLGQGAYTGCTVNTAEIVSIDSNSQESRILIDRSLVTQQPNLEFTLCLNADQNNSYRDNLKQDLLCASGYTFNEAPIDKFDFYLTNQFSDLSRDITSERQFIKATMPFPLLALNDITLMRQSLKQEYQTEATTIGEILEQGFNYLFTGFVNPILDTVTTYNSMTGTIPNIGGDFNLNRPLDPTYIGGIVFFKVKGITVLNKQDLIRQYPDEEIDAIDSDELIKYLNYKGLSYSVDPTTIEIYGSDMKRLLIVKDTAPLIINEEFTESSYSKTDENNTFQSLPTKLRFSIITNMWYDDERHVKKTTVPITITALVTKNQLVLNDLVDSISTLVTDPARWIGENIFYILIFLVFLLIVSVIYYNFKVKGG